MLRAMLLILFYLVIDHFQLSSSAVYHTANYSWPYLWGIELYPTDACGLYPELTWGGRCYCGGSCGERKYWKSPYDALVNVAFNRPSEVSSLWNCLDSSEAKCYGCDNQLRVCVSVNSHWNPDYLTAGCDGQHMNCIHTDDDKPPWWFVNLQRPYTLRFIMIRPRRAYTGKDAQVNTAGRFANMVLAVDTHICYQWPNYQLASTIPTPNVFHYVTCTAPSTGRFVRLQKLKTNLGHKGNLNVINFCEMTVWSCPKGKFGGATYDPSGLNWDTKAPFTCTNCPATCPLYCDNHDGCLPIDNMEQLKKRSADVAAYNYAHFLTVERFGVLPAVDQISFPADQGWYQSTYASASANFLRVILGRSYLITGAAVYTTTAHQNTMYETEVRVGRGYHSNQEKKRWLEFEIRCWRDGGAIGTGVDQPCDTCSQGLLKCPRADHAVVLEHGGANYLQITEFAVFGLIIKETAVGTSCGGPCKLEFCAQDFTCNGGKCRGGSGDYCQSDDECGQLQQCNYNLCTPRTGSPCTGLCLRGSVCEGTQENGLFCVLRPGNGPCTGDEHCFQHGANINVCDAVGICKRGVGSSCTQHSDCLAGAECTGNKCTCDAEVSTTVGNICVPIVYNKECEGPENCTALHSNCTNGKCVCRANFTVVHRDFSCKAAAGKSCNDIPCGEGLVCDPQTKICRIENGGGCQVDKPEECVEKTSCDPKQKRCLTKEGEPCETDNQCVSETKCVFKGDRKKCLIIPGGDCTYKYNFCLPCYICSRIIETVITHYCFPDIGTICDPEDPKLQCPQRNVCDKDYYDVYRCKKPEPNVCANDDECREHAECKQGTQSRNCYLVVGAPCNATDTCGPNLYCDKDGVCRINVNQPCTSNPTFCVLGAFCDRATNTCKCINTTTQEGVLCKANGPTNVDKECTLPPAAGQVLCKNAGHAVCDPTKRTCQCRPGYLPTFDYVCKPDIGNPCTVHNTTDAVSTDPQVSGLCALNGVCDDNTCKVPIGEPCYGDRKDHCETGSQCAPDYMCKINVGGSCDNGMEHMCFDGLICDDFKICKQPTGGECRDHSFCVGGSLCDNNTCTCNTDVTKNSSAGNCGGPKDGEVFGTCSAEIPCKDPNAHCNSTGSAPKCKCNAGYEPSPLDFSCKRAVGQPCQSVDDCAPGKVCDKERSVCIPGVGSPCVVGEDIVCETGAQCDDGDCRISLGGKCDGDNKKYLCVLGSKCDELTCTCKIPVMIECNPETANHCESGARCISTSKKDEPKHFMCVCNPKTTEEQAGVCVPKPGQPKGDCQLGGKCIEGAHCVKDKTPKLCECDAAFPFNPIDYTCAGSRASKKEEENNYGPLLTVVLSVFGGLMGIGLILLAIMKRRRSVKQHALEKEMSVRLFRVKSLGSTTALALREGELLDKLAAGQLGEEDRVELERLQHRYGSPIDAEESSGQSGHSGQSEGDGESSVAGSEAESGVDY